MSRPVGLRPPGRQQLATKTTCNTCGRMVTMRARRSADLSVFLCDECFMIDRIRSLEPPEGASAAEMLGWRQAKDAAARVVGDVVRGNNRPR